MLTQCRAAPALPNINPSHFKASVKHMLPSSKLFDSLLLTLKGFKPGADKLSKRCIGSARRQNSLVHGCSLLFVSLHATLVHHDLARTAALTSGAFVLTSSVEQGQPSMPH
jgi:hypothetical protein